MIWGTYLALFVLFLITSFWYAMASRPLASLLTDELKQLKATQKLKAAKK